MEHIIHFDVDVCIDEDFMKVVYEAETGKSFDREDAIRRIYNRILEGMKA